MTDTLINAQILTFKELSESQQKKLINDFNENNSECWQAFYDFNSDIEFILKDYPQYLKIFEFCENKTDFQISFSQGDYANIGINSIDFQYWLKTLKNSETYSKLSKSLLRCDNAFNQINANIEFEKKYVNICGYYIDDKYYDKYKDIIDFFICDIEESIKTINRLVYNYIYDSYLSCFDNEYAIEELSQYNFTSVNNIIVSQDFI